jgi:flagellar hook assembly protein FlgD
MKTLNLVLLFIALFPALACCSVRITDIKVENSVFSPNGDGVLDSSYVSFSVITDLGWAAIWVWVTDAGGTTVRTLAADQAAAPGTVEKAWDGRTASGQRAPEGNYAFRMYARAGEDTTPAFSAGILLDVSAPTFSTLISPSPYAPDLALADSLLSVKVFIEGSEPDDWLSVSVTVDELPETLCTEQLDLGDTTYECTWDGRSESDGVYALGVAVYDKAGNRNEAMYAVDLDIQGPSLAITGPARTYLDALPERVAGFAFDRSGIDSLGFRFLADAEYGPVMLEGSGDTLYWYVPWPEDLPPNRTYALQVMARDTPGHTTTATREAVIDTEAPQSPVLSPLPASASRPRVQISGTCSGLDSVFVYLNGEMEGGLVCSAAGTFSIDVMLAEGTNTIYAVARDKAGNTSPPSETLTITYTKVVGISVPEVFNPESIMDITLAQPADLITLRVYSLEGAYVATLSKRSPDLVDEMTWDLRDSQGEHVKNGAYLMVFEIDYSSGDRTVEKRAVVVVR